MNSGVVYYSRSNNTRTAALHLAKIIGAETVEIIEENGGKGLFGLIKNVRQTSKGQLPELQGSPWKATEGLDKIYLMAPIWGGEIAPAMAAFLQKTDFKGKEAVVVTFQGDRNGEGSSKVHDKIKKLVIDNGGSFREGHALHSAFPGKFAGKEYIESQIDKHFR
jgi:flavodoxin